MTQRMKDFTFESYGVKVCVECSDDELSARSEAIVRTSLLGRLSLIDRIDAEHVFSMRFENGNFHLALNGEYVTDGESEIAFFKFFETMIRITIAEYAVGRVFMHSGAVVWNGKAIIFPGNSYSGKSTLVAEFVKRGATYYSDEYSILDEKGYVHPFPRPLSLRVESEEPGRVEATAESLGGLVGTEPLPVSFVFLMQYKPNARWNPKVLSPGVGVMKMVPQAISVRFQTKFALEVLNNVTRHAIILETLRGEANKTVNKIANLLTS